MIHDKHETHKSPQTDWNCIESYGISHETYLDLALDLALGVWSNLVMQEAIEEMLKVPWRSYHGCQLAFWNDSEPTF